MNPGRLITTLKWILRIGGLWKPDGDGRFSRLYKVYSWCFIFTFSVMYTAFMCANLYFLRDISELAEMLFVSMTELALVVKIINFYVNNSRLKYMLRCMRGFRLETQAEQEIMQSRLAFLIKSTIIYYFCANTSIQATAVNSAFNETDKLMYSGYYPGVDWQHNRADYWFVLGYQYIGILFTCQINLAIDSYFCTMMYLLSGQAIILGNRLSNAGAAGNSKRQSSIEQRSALVKNIETHNDIVQFIQNLQHCLWWSFLGQMVLSAITVGSIVNEMLSVSENWAVHENENTCYYMNSPIGFDDRKHVRLSIKSCRISGIHHTDFHYVFSRTMHHIRVRNFARSLV